MTDDIKQREARLRSVAAKLPGRGLEMDRLPEVRRDLYCELLSSGTFEVVFQVPRGPHDLEADFAMFARSDALTIIDAYRAELAEAKRAHADTKRGQALYLRLRDVDRLAESYGVEIATAIEVEADALKAEADALDRAAPDGKAV